MNCRLNMQGGVGSPSTLGQNLHFLKWPLDLFLASYLLLFTCESIFSGGLPPENSESVEGKATPLGPCPSFLPPMFELF